MSEQYRVELTDEGRKTLEAVESLGVRIQPGIARAMDRENVFTVSHIQQAYLSFPKGGPSTPIGCRVQTNRLRNSIRASATVISGDAVISAIGSNVVYAAPLEFGATIPPHTIRAKGKALRFRIGERVIFAKSVKFPGAVLQPREFVQRGIQDRLPEYSEAFGAAIQKLFEENK